MAPDTTLCLGDPAWQPFWPCLVTCCLSEKSCVPASSCVVSSPFLSGISLAVTLGQLFGWLGGLISSLPHHPQMASSAVS